MVGKYEEDNIVEKEDDQEDDLDEEDDLWVSQFYTDVDYGLLDTPTNLIGRTVVTNLEGWSRSGTLAEFQSPPRERRMVSSHLETESGVETADIISISPVSALVDRQGDTPVRNEDTVEVDTDRSNYSVRIGETPPADILSPLLSGGGDIRTSSLIPHTEQLTPSIDSSVRDTGSHGIIPSGGLSSAETQEVKEDRSQVQETVQVLRKNLQHQS